MPKKQNYRKENLKKSWTHQKHQPLDDTPSSVVNNGAGPSHQRDEDGGGSSGAGSHQRPSLVMKFKRVGDSKDWRLCTEHSAPAEVSGAEAGGDVVVEPQYGGGDGVLGEHQLLEDELMRGGSPPPAGSPGDGLLTLSLTFHLPHFALSSPLGPFCSLLHVYF